MRTRRLFLRDSAITLFGLGATPGWLARAAFGAQTRRKKILVAVFQRGAVDGYGGGAFGGEKLAGFARGGRLRHEVRVVLNADVVRNDAGARVGLE